MSQPVIVRPNPNRTGDRTLWHDLEVLTQVLNQFLNNNVSNGDGFMPIFYTLLRILQESLIINKRCLFKMKESHKAYQNQ